MSSPKRDAARKHGIDIIPTPIVKKRRPLAQTKLRRSKRVHRKLSFDEKSFNPRAYKGSQAGNPASLRTDTAATVIHDDIEVPILTTAVFSLDGFPLTEEQKENLLSGLKKGFAENIPSYCSPQKLGVSSAGDPNAAYVYTPNKKNLVELPLHNSLGFMSFFSNQHKKKPLFPALDANHLPDDLSLQLQQFASQPEEIKRRAATITQASCNKARRERQLGIARYPSQNGTMGGPATAYGTIIVKAFLKHLAQMNGKEDFAELPKDIRKEWAHLISNAFLGQSSQDPDNLIGVDPDVNGLMLILELEAYNLLKHYDQVKLNTITPMIVPTHLPKDKIHYDIQTKDFNLPITIDTQNPQRPHASLRIYFHLFVEAYMKMMQATNENVNAFEDEVKQNAPAKSPHTTALFSQTARKKMSEQKVKELNLPLTQNQTIIISPFKHGTR
ncbi:MAG TPA: hypothetical protein VHZ76_06035 [Gammaproteobacteria bacterium]|jgi:hypothetical protein|nr:hypothetical protein [Gammaproteobacteria bacterium]